MDTRAAAQHWADTWARAWTANEVEPIVALYAESARYVTEPFREPRIGTAGAREYLVPVMAGQREVRALVIDEWDAWNVFEGVREPLAGWGLAR